MFHIETIAELRVLDVLGVTVDCEGNLWIARGSSDNQVEQRCVDEIETCCTDACPCMGEPEMDGEVVLLQMCAKVGALRCSTDNFHDYRVEEDTDETAAPEDAPETAEGADEPALNDNIVSMPDGSKRIRGKGGKFTKGA